MEKFNNIKTKLTNNIESLSQLVKQTGIIKFESLLNGFNNRLLNNNFLITVVGEFNRGKSTLINAMLGTDILPISVKPTTALLHLISYAETSSLRIHYKDGKVQQLPFNKGNLENFTAMSDFDNTKIKHIEIKYPADFLKNGTVIIDTPGVNDIDEQRLDITYGYMPLSDSTIFLFNASTPLKITEKIFLEEKILSNNITNIFFIVNKIDDLDESEIKDTTEYFRTNIQKLLKNDEVKIFPLASKRALEGRLQNDKELINCSGINDFQNRLNEFLQSTDKLNVKLRKASADFKTIVHSFLSELDIELIQLEQSKENLAKMLTALQQLKTKHLTVFNDLLKYNEEQKTKITITIDKALIKRYKEVEEESLFRIDMEQRDLSLFAEKEFPRKINLVIKQWLEQNKPSIDRTLDEIVKNSLVAFEKHFSKRPVLDSLLKLTNVQIEETKGLKLDGQEKMSQVAKVAYGAGLIIVGGAVAWMTGGLGYPALMAGLGGGGLSQKLIGSHFGKKTIAAQKQLLIEEVPNCLRDKFTKLQLSINSEINNYFTYFDQKLKKEFDKVFNELEEGLKQKMEAYKSQSTELEKKKAVLSNSRQKAVMLLKED